MSSDTWLNVESIGIGGVGHMRIRNRQNCMILYAAVFLRVLQLADYPSAVEVEAEYMDIA